MADAISVSFIEAADDQAKALELPDEPGKIKIEKSFLDFENRDYPAARKAADRLASRQVYTPQKFRALTAGARQRAFTISARISQEARTKARDLIAEMITTGADKKRFAEELKHLPMSPAHVEQVFRNNINTAYSQGLEDVLAQPIVGEQFPYRAYNAIMDDRVRPEHLILETLGIQETNIYHKDDPVWQTFRPPWSWNCRCAWRPVSIREAAHKGINEAKQWLDSGIEPPHEFVKPPPFQPDPQWQRDNGDVSR